MTMIGIETLLGGEQKRLRSLPSRQTGCRTSTNNPFIICDHFNKSLYEWPHYERAHKCKGCGSKNHGQTSCIKGKKQVWGSGVGGNGLEECVVGTVDIAIANETKSFQRFINVFPCLPAPPKPNTTTTRFRFADASQPPLKESPSSLKPIAWANLLQAYSGPLRVYLPMILSFGVELGYQSPQDAFILSKNLASALKDPNIIVNKLVKDLALRRVIKVTSVPPFIFSLLRLIPKHDDGFCRIYHLSYYDGVKAYSRSGRRPALGEAKSGKPKGSGNRLAGFWYWLWLERFFCWVGYLAFIESSLLIK